jgi:hypothetical protein
MLPRSGTIIYIAFIFLFRNWKWFYVRYLRRFQMTSAAPDGSTVPMSQSMMVDTFIPPYQLTPTMDIFAAVYVVPFIVPL